MNLSNTKIWLGQISNGQYEEIKTIMREMHLDLNHIQDLPFPQPPSDLCSCLALTISEHRVVQEFSDKKEWDKSVFQELSLREAFHYDTFTTQYHIYQNDKHGDSFSIGYFEGLQQDIRLLFDDKKDLTFIPVSFTKVDSRKVKALTVLKKKRDQLNKEIEELENDLFIS